jgi:hypothetical protein
MKCCFCRRPPVIFWDNAFTPHFCRTQSVFAKQIMPSLRILCNNGSLVTWTIVSLTTAFKPLIFSISDFALSYTANLFVLMILYDFCLFPAQFCYIILYMRKVWKSWANGRPMCTQENFLWCEEPCFACAAILRSTCLPLIPNRDKRKSLLTWSVLYWVLV